MIVPVLMRMAHYCRCEYSKRRGIVTTGVQAIVLTRKDSLVLVRHTYLKGWHLPGGGAKRGETPEVAVLRELKEEIGLISYGEIKSVSCMLESHDDRKVRMHIFIVTGVTYKFRRSLEIAETREFDWKSLPADAGVARSRLGLLNT